MSAFLCSDNHVSALAIWAESAGLGRAERIARDLRTENNRALMARYRARPARHVMPETLAQWRTRADTISPPFVRALADCLAYQCHEGQKPGPGLAVLTVILCKLDDVQPAAGVWSIE